MFGWYETIGAIHLPLRVFSRAGWAYPTFQHEVAHYVLGATTPYGIAEKELSLWALFSKIYGTHKLNNLFLDLISTMNSNSFLAQEGLATYIGIEEASQGDIPNVADGMINSLNARYRNAYLEFRSIMEALSRPPRERRHIATFLGLMAHGSDILDDWCKGIDNVQAFKKSLLRHAPDKRFVTITEEVRKLPADVLSRWIDSYKSGNRPEAPNGLKSVIPIVILDAKEVSNKALDFHRGFCRIIRQETIQANLSDDVFGKVCEYIARFWHLHASYDPIWKVVLTPDRPGATRVFAEDLPSEVWEYSEVFLLRPNVLEFSSVSYSRSPLDGILLRPGEIEVSAFSKDSTRRITIGDRRVLKRRLGLLRKDQHVFVSSECYDFDHCEVRGLSLVGDIPHYVLHIGEFATLAFTLLAPDRRKDEKFEVHLLTSKKAEDNLPSVEPGIQSSSRDVFGYGYVVFRLRSRPRLIVVWPTPTFVAERILGSTDVCSYFGLNVVRPENAFRFLSCDMFLGLMRLRNHFESPIEA